MSSVRRKPKMRVINRPTTPATRWAVKLQFSKALRSAPGLNPICMPSSDFRQLIVRQRKFRHHASQRAAHRMLGRAAVKHLGENRRATN